MTDGSMEMKTSRKMKPMNNRAVFLDRDGTIIEDVGYLSDPGKVKMLPGTPRALKKLKKMGMALVVVSNQSGVARGMFAIEDVNATNARMKELFSREKIEFDAIYFCPHLEGCRCRKPSGGMVERAAKELKVDPSQSYVVGDRVSDLGLARTVGAQAILVLTGYGSETLKELDGAGLAPDHIATDLQAAVDWITKMENSK